jgi:two-component system, LuxR family, sensor kinase FixL
VIHDLGEQTTAAQAQRDSELRLRAILETIPDALIVIDEQGIICSFSPAAERMFGYTEAEIVGRNVAVTMPSPDREHHSAYIARYVASGKPRIIGTNRVLLGVRKNGEIFPHGISIGEFTIGGKRFFTGFVRDLTERQKAEKRVEDLQAELIHIARFSTMGEMASALAHELNQPLAALTNYLQTVRRSLAAPDENSARLENIVGKALDQAFLAAQIVRRIREFVHKGKSQRRAEKLNRVVEEALALAIVGTERHGVRIAVNFERHPALVLIDKVQIQQVVLNLVRNAIEAMEHSEPRELLVVTSAPRGSRSAVIKIVDTGPGIAADIAERLFEPFVSTKEGGLGLGLSICREIVEAHGGQILAAPNLPRGAVFSITLPTAPESRQE